MITPRRGRLRQFLHEYGRTGLAIYIGVYLSTLSSLFLVVDKGLLSPEDAVAGLKYIGVDRIIDLDRINPKAGNFAVAWILAKFTEPFRMGITLAITPALVKFLKAKKKMGK